MRRQPPSPMRNAPRAAAESACGEGGTGPLPQAWGRAGERVVRRGLRGEGGTGPSPKHGGGLGVGVRHSCERQESRILPPPPSMGEGWGEGCERGRGNNEGFTLPAMSYTADLPPALPLRRRNQPRPLAGNPVVVGRRQGGGPPRVRRLHPSGVARRVERETPPRRRRTVRPRVRSRAPAGWGARCARRASSWGLRSAASIRRTDADAACICSCSLPISTRSRGCAPPSRRTATSTSTVARCSACRGATR